MQQLAQLGRGGFVARLLIAAAIVAFALLAFLLRDVLLLIFAAVLVAVALKGLARSIEKASPLKGGWSLAAAALGVLSVLTGAAWLLGAQIAAQAAQASETLPAAWQQFKAQAGATAIGASLLAEIESARSSASTLSGVVPQLGRFTLSFAGAALDALVVVIAAAFLAADPRIYRNGVLALFPRPVHGGMSAAFDDCAAALRKWLLGTLVSMLFLGVVVSLGLWALGVPAPLALGVLAGLSQLVPLIGPIVAAVPGILIALTAGPQTALLAAALYFAASQVEANLIYPLVQQKAVSLPPALTLFAVVALGLLMGPLGAVLATPLVVVAAVFVVRFYVRAALGNHARIPGRS